MAEGWRRREREPVAPGASRWTREPAASDPAASRWTEQPAQTRHVVTSVHRMAAVPDEDPLPSVDPRYPRLERLLSWVLPLWAARRAAARRTRYHAACWKQITAAHDAPDRDRDHLPSRYGPAWRGSRCG